VTSIAGESAVAANTEPIPKVVSPKRMTGQTAEQIRDGTARQDRGRKGQQVAVHYPLLGSHSADEVASMAGRARLATAVEEGDHRHDDRHHHDPARGRGVA
jgi:hypothetical protein